VGQPRSGLGQTSVGQDKIAERWNQVANSLNRQEGKLSEG